MKIVKFMCNKCGCEVSEHDATQMNYSEHLCKKCYVKFQKVAAEIGVFTKQKMQEFWGDNVHSEVKDE